MLPYQVEQYAFRLLEEQGLDDWGFEFLEARRTAGLCIYKRKVIAVSRPFIRLNSDLEIIDTVKHEVAHALVGSQAHHGPIWRLKCIELGGNPEATCTDGLFPMGKYVAVCRVCGKRHHKYRKPKGLRFCKKCYHLGFREPLEYKI